MEIIASGGSVVEKQHENRSLKLMGNLGIYSGMRVYQLGFLMQDNTEKEKEYYSRKRGQWEYDRMKRSIRPRISYPKLSLYEKTESAFRQKCVYVNSCYICCRVLQRTDTWGPAIKNKMSSLPTTYRTLVVFTQLQVLLTTALPDDSRVLFKHLLHFRTAEQLPAELLQINLIHF